MDSTAQTAPRDSDIINETAATVDFGKSCKNLSAIQLSDQKFDHSEQLL